MANQLDTKEGVTEINISPAKRLQVEVYDRFEPLAGLQQEWDDFAQSAGSEIFLTYDWCRIWWKYYGKGRDLRIYVFRSEGKLVGLLPLFFERIRLGRIFVRAGKIVGSDFTLAQFSPPIDPDHIGQVTEALSKPLLKEKWDVVHIGPLAGLYNHYDALSEAMQGAFGDECDISCRKKQVQTYFFVAGTWEAQLASLSKNARRNIKRKCKALEEALQRRPGEMASDLATIENMDDMFLGFVRMHQQHWQNRGKLGHFGDWPDSFDFHREMAHAQLKRDRLRLMRIHWGECCLAYEYTYRFGDKHFALLNSRTDIEDLAEANVGTTIFAERMKRAMSENVKYVDDMRAKYDYKLRLGGKLLPMRDIYISRKQPLSLVRLYVFRLIARFLHLCYYKMWFCILAPKLPFKRRALWALWIRTHFLTS